MFEEADRAKAEKKESRIRQRSKSGSHIMGGEEPVRIVMLRKTKWLLVFKKRKNSRNIGRQ